MIVDIRTTAPTTSFALKAGGEMHDVLLDWNARTADWRATITRRTDGRTVVAHARVSPQAPVVEFPGVGALYAFGSSPYNVDAFNTGALYLEWLTQVELDYIFAVAPSGVEWRLA